MYKEEVKIPNENIRGLLCIPHGSDAIIVFVHGSGSDRFSVLNSYASRVLNEAGFATLLVDLLTEDEKEVDSESKHLRFDIDLLTRRLVSITRWIADNSITRALKIGYFSSSTGTAAALNSLSQVDTIAAIFSRGGRIDLCNTKILKELKIPLLLAVGGKDDVVLSASKLAIKEVSNSSLIDLSIIPKASHYFEEPDTLETVVKLSVMWFRIHLLKYNDRLVNPFKQQEYKLFSNGLKSRLQIRFTDRTSAGHILANMLSKYKTYRDLIIVGIPRGGIIIADIISEKLSNAEFGIIISKRLRNPDNSESAIGTVLYDGSIYMNIIKDDISQNYIESEISNQKKNLAKQITSFGLDGYMLNCQDKTVILVDDGADTGSTVLAAAKLINSQSPKELIIALPVVSKHIISLLHAEARKVEFIRSPRNLKSVDEYYKDFSQVNNSEVTTILKKRLKVFTYNENDITKVM